MARSNPASGSEILQALRQSACAHLNQHLFEGINDQKTPGASKYGNKKITIDGITFDSIKEGKRYGALRMLHHAGLITQPHHHIRAQLSSCWYEPDFVYWDKRTAELVVEDVKSSATRKNRIYRLKKAMMKNELSIEIREV